MATHEHRRHLVHSHAKEGDIPGTVDLRAAEGDDTAYGQALYPVPAEDPNDPLQWPEWKKSMILAVCACYSFLGNSALLGPSVYIGLYAEQFNISPNKASNLISYANLAFGFGSLLLVPLYHKIGRRPVMLGSLLCYCAGLIGASQSNSYGALMGCRVVHGFGSGVCEALPVQLVNDIFFLHERGKRLGYYTVCLCLGSTGPLYAGYMLAGGLSWRLFFLVEFAFAGALFVIAFFVVEETTYHRKTPALSPSPTSADVVLGAAAANGSSNSEKPAAVLADRPNSNNDNDNDSDLSASVPPRKTFLQTLKFWGVWERDSDFFLMMARSFTYFLVPHVFWVVTTYGIYIGLGALSFNYIFPLKITAAPYNWSETSSGLIAVASLIGYGLAIPFTPSSDIIAARLTRRNGGIREAEMRLSAMLPAMLLAPTGLIIFGFAAQRNLHWVVYFVGVGLTQFSSYFYFTFTLAYAIDSYTTNVSEMLIAMNLGKQAISFGMGLDLLEWITEHGYAVMIAGAFTAVLLANNLSLIIFMLFGKRIRIFMSHTWLARMHKSSVREVATH
ncbi:Major facilitator superfamily domain, general substrate transporter [Niveomyces insectorum RCEF 264]|uniref:Major facilitator superfamily domain, general substrate transporter n=1 Tax=Niveomyces insectorum RCEF 264 TaxID=1081102 RepID=A0A162MLD7_9HYPO|nr:Major facilitator superfamily domain, general substrate transporter [Niveomyces insectorum RCEF 264]